MSKIKIMLMFAAIATVSILASCGGGSDSTESEKDILLDALAGTWNLDASSSTFANTELDGSGISVTFSATGYTLSGGGITDYTDGGSYTVTDEGTITNASVNIKSADLELDGTPTVSINSAKTSITVSFNTKEANKRAAGLGAFSLLFKKAE